MAMKKADMEIDNKAYQMLLSKAKDAEREGLLNIAMKAALESWNFIDGMMQYQRRYEQQEFTSITTIHMILRYAPLLLDAKSLDHLEELLNDYRRIERNTSDSLVEKLVESRAKLKDNHRLWHLLEYNSDVRMRNLRSELGGDQDYWRMVCERWEKMGLIIRTPVDGSYELELATRLGQLVTAKCFGCGSLVEAPKAMFFETFHCDTCESATNHVILSNSSISDEGN